MTGSYLYFPDLWLSLFALAFLTALRAGSSVRVYAAVNATAKIIGVNLRAVWQRSTVTTIKYFILKQTRAGYWLPRQKVSLLSIAPLLTSGLIGSNDLHHLIWRSFDVVGSVLSWLGSSAWLKIAHVSGLGLLNFLVFTLLFQRLPRQRGPIIVILIGLVGALAIYILEQAQVLDRDLSLSMFGIAFIFLTYAFLLLAVHFLDPIRLARRMTIKQLRTGMLVLNRNGWVVSLNPAAERILQVPAGQARGRPIGELLPAYQAEPLADTGGTELEISLGSGQNLRHCTLSISLLKDWRGVRSGYLLLIHDVTVQKQSQAQIIEQQQALATLQERERLARELHDSIGQVLGYASFQVEAAAQLSRDGQAATAASQLDRLGRVLRDAHADVREHILNLRSAPSLQRPFFMAVQQYLESFTNNYDIQTHLTIDSAMDSNLFSPDAQMQVFRIMQEALSNARKHGRAHHIQVKFEAQDKRVCIIIEDDGYGFSPDNGSMIGGHHFGFQFMEERARQLGASLEIKSIQGKGTRVVLQMPGREL